MPISHHRKGIWQIHAIDVPIHRWLLFGTTADPEWMWRSGVQSIDVKYAGINGFQTSYLLLRLKPSFVDDAIRVLAGK
jgi:hypothetical protein